MQRRCFQRRGIRRLPEIEGDKTSKKTFEHCPLGNFYIDIAGETRRAGVPPPEETGKMQTMNRGARIVDSRGRARDRP